MKRSPPTFSAARSRIWQPDSDGAAALSYSNTGNKLGYSAGQVTGSLMHGVFVGPDDTVWVAVGQRFATPVR